MKELGVGLIGTGFMGKAHSIAYRDAPVFFGDLGARPVMKVVCGRDRERTQAAARRYGWETYSTSWQEVVARQDVDLVDIAAPGHLHAEIALAAAAAGKAVFCEKPLANSLPQARAMLEAARSAGVAHMVGFNHRCAPAVALMKQLIAEGAVGQVYHVRAVLLTDSGLDPTSPLDWRMDAQKAGTGVHSDFGAHIIDLARHLVGEIVEVASVCQTFVDRRPLAHDPDSSGPVTTDDAALFLARFANGALGSFESSRMVAGRKNHTAIEINGSRGSLAFNLERINEVAYFDATSSRHTQGWSTILVADESQPHIRHLWPPVGSVVRWSDTFTIEVAELIRALAGGRRPQPDFEDGVRCQTVLEAVWQAGCERRWVRLDESAWRF